MKLKIIEWNINQRLNFAGRNMPDLIAEAIIDQNADIIALTEVYKGNNWEDFKKAAFQSNYAVFETFNNSAGQNDIAIAININKLNVIYIKSFYPGTEGIPDFLEVKCMDKESNNEFTFICIRIHALVSNNIKRKELEHIMSVTKNEATVIVCGDFNNYRRGFVDVKKEWSLTEICNICKKNNFVVKTPDGSSIYEENLNNPDYQFPEDHFLLKGIDEDNITLLAYDRDFVEKNKQVYKWGRDFQKYLGKDKKGENIYDSVPPPFPDHAILKCNITFDALMNKND